MDIFQAIILGIIQGITAWIPVSSKTQVLIFGTLLFGLSFNELLSFAIIVHIGDLIATLYLFRKELLAMQSVRPSMSDLKNFTSLPENKKLAYFLVISFFFTAILALPLYLLVKNSFSELAGTTLLALIGLVMIVMGLIMYFSKAPTGTNKLNLKTTIITGLAQGLSVLPGISRSGITESALLVQNIDQSRAVKLSFMMSIPTIVFAIAGFNVTDGFKLLSPTVIVIGIIASTITAYLTMSVMLELAKRIKFYWFSFGIGILAIIPLFVKLIFNIG